MDATRFRQGRLDLVSSTLEEFDDLDPITLDGIYWSKVKDLDEFRS